MFGSIRNSSQAPVVKKQQQRKQEGQCLSEGFRPENFIPGLVIGFICGFVLDLFKPSNNPPRKNAGITGSFVGRPHKLSDSSVPDSSDDLKMVLVVRQDLKMGTGKIASQCAHAATGMYQELMQSQRSLLRQWECSGQPKIVVTCKSQQEMNKLKSAAESIGLPTYVVADAGRTQVLSGSKTVLAIGPGRKTCVDSVTGKQRLL
ncbi:hypothetical protein V2J09_011062 [Rumex salicifolius]